MTIGSLQTGSGGFTGDIAEVRFYRGALSAAEVSVLRDEVTSFYANQAPVAVADQYQATEDQLLFVNAATGVLANDTDADGDVLSAVLLERTQHGSLALSADGSFVYAANPNFFGTDSFTYAARDFRNSAPVQVTIQVASGYDPAVAVGDSYQGLPSQPLEIFGLIGVLANDINIDRLPLRAVLESAPSNGQLALREDGGFRYDPQGFAGTTSFTYRIHDGTGLSSPATVTLVLNTPPAPQADSFTTPEDTTLVRTAVNGVLANDQDADGNALTVELVSSVSRGTLTLAPNGAFQYQPELNYFGTDSFQYRVTDGIDTSPVVIASITVSPVNDAPSTVGDVYFGAAGEPLEIPAERGVLVNDVDVDSASLSAVLLQRPANGTVVLQPDGSFRYEPEAGFIGTDLFTYQAADGQTASSATEVRLFVGTSPLRINEIMVANVDGEQTRVRATPEESFRGEVMFPDWIELQNLSPGELDISGYHLTDNEFHRTLWQFPSGTTIPPGGYLVVYGGDIPIDDVRLDQTGRLHTNFNLSIESEYVAVTSPDGSLLDAWGGGYPDQVPNVSFGVDSAGQLAFLRAATPGAANSESYLGLTADTRFSVDRGFYTSPIQVEISTAQADATIYYSFDGSPPTPQSGLLYSGPITVDRTTTLRAAAYKDGYLTPNVDTQTYLFLDAVLQQAAAPQTGPTGQSVTYPERWGAVRGDYEMDPEVTGDPAYADQMQAAMTALPSLSLTLAFEDIFGTRGLYSTPQSTAEKPSSAELIFPDGTTGFQIDAGMRMQGGASRAPEHLKHSMSLRFREDYGSGSLEYPLFPESPVSTFNSIHLRARYNNSWIHWDQGQRNRGSMIREAWMRDTMLAAGEAAAGHGRYVHLYLNGLYWGVYEMHERQDASHYANYFGGDSYQYDATNAGVPVDGSRDSWTALQATVRSGNWEQIQAALDIDNHIRYTIVNLFGGNQDLKSDGNWRTAGGGLADAPWQFYVWDAERVLENVNQRGTSPIADLVGFLARLDDHEEYVTRFGDIIHELFFNDGALTPEKTAARWMNRAAELDLAIIAESARWGDARQANPLTKNDRWLPEQTRLLETYFPVRTQNVLEQQLRGRFYPNTEAPEFLVNGNRQHGGVLQTGDQLAILNPNDGIGMVYFTRDGSDPRQSGGSLNPQAMLYTGQPITLEETTEIRMRILHGDEWSALSRATFVTEVPANAANLRITEINYHPHAAETARGEPNVDPREFEFIELRNVSDVPVNLNGVRLVQVPVDGNREGVVYEFAAQRLLPGENVVVARNREAFLARYGQRDPMPAFAQGSDGVGGPEGQWSGGQLGDGGERITLIDAAGDLIQQVDYRDGGEWPELADGSGATLVLIDPLGDGNDSANWRASVRFGGTPGSSTDYSFPSIVINEVLSNSTAPLVDQIELYNAANQPVVLSNWYLSDTDGDLRRYQFPVGTLIEPNGFLVLDQNTLGFGFKGSEGDDVWLTAGTARGEILGFVDHARFGATEPDSSLGRWPNGSGDLFPQVSPSFGAVNPGPTVSPLIISEVHYHPAAAEAGFFASDPDAGRHLEFVEIWNTDAAPRNLSGWRLSDAVDLTFSPSLTLAPNTGLIAVSFDPELEPTIAAAFREHYGIEADVVLMGPYAGALSNGGERLQLERAIAASPDVYVLSDRVSYDDAEPWPSDADGGGSSLQRRRETAFGDLAASWQSAVPNPGTARFLRLGDYDFNGDAVVDVQDVDLLCDGIRSGHVDSDLNQDGTSDVNDLVFLIRSVLGTNPGDANLDGQFNSTDLVRVFQAGLYEDGIPRNSSWATGDWNCDGDFTSSDLVMAFQSGAYSQAAQASHRASDWASAVDELVGDRSDFLGSRSSSSQPATVATDERLRRRDGDLLQLAVDSLFTADESLADIGGHRETSESDAAVWQLLDEPIDAQ
jgi:hypothetical protein